MAEHVLVFGAAYDIPARIAKAGEESGQKVTTSLMCWPEHLAKLEDARQHARIIVIPRAASDQEWIAFARTIHAAEPVTRIGSFYDDCRRQAAAVGLALGLDTYFPEIVELVTDKYAMRQRLAGKGVEVTASAVAGSGEMLRAFAAEHGYPCVVKPLTGEASKGVSILREPADAEAAFARASGADADSRVTVEEFLAGPQYSVESFSEAREHVVVAITRKYSDPVSLVELGHVMPAPLEPGQEAEMAAHVIDALDALGVEFGPAHTEVILTERGPRIIETHVRTGGDEIWDMVTGATGVDLIEGQLRQVLGERVLPGIRAILADPDRVRRCEAVWFAGAPAEGTLIEVVGAGAEYPENVHVVVTGAAGTELNGLQEGDSRLARARAHGATAAEALALAREAIGRLEFITRVCATQTELL